MHAIEMLSESSIIYYLTNSSQHRLYDLVTDAIADGYSWSKNCEGKFELHIGNMSHIKPHFRTRLNYWIG